MSEQITYLEQLVRKYPYVSKNKPFHVTLKTLTLDINEIAYFDFRNGQLVLNDKLYKDFENLISMKKSAIKNGRSVKVNDNYIRFATITHEYGHALENGIIKHEAKLNNQISEFMADPNSFMIKGRKDIKKKMLADVAKQLKVDYLSDEIAISLLGKYGIDGPAGEIFAESFALYELGDRTNPFAIALENILKSYGVI